MAVFNVRQFVRQTAALSYKNVVATVLRQPISFLVFNYGLPLAILAVLLSIPSFFTPSSHFGVGAPAPIRDFSINDGKKLVIIKKPTLGPDVDRVITSVTKNIDPQLIHHLENEKELPTLCLANLRGVSDCYASVTFWDSPETNGSVDFTKSQNGTHTWQYTIRADPSKDDAHFNVFEHNTAQETLFLPLQLAISRAITNSTIRPEVMMYTWETDEQQSDIQRSGFVAAVGQIYAFAVFACFWLIIYRLTSQITSERESGMAQLVDSMGGGSATLARVLSWLITYNLACLPVFIGFGGLYHRILFSKSDLSTLVGWQILLGMAVNSSTVFASSFFSKSRVSAVYVVGVFLLMSVVAQVYSFQLYPKPESQGVIPLCLLFASSNFLFFLQQMCLWELNGLKADITQIPKPDAGINSTSYNLSQSTMLLFLGIQIIVFPILAMAVEKFMHGIDFHSRSFSEGGGSTGSIVAEASDLRKRFSPNFLEKIFCCGKRRSVTAVDGVSLQGHKGQILCLVGPNGSGKTTTLHMIAGFISPSSGSVKLGATPSQIGICPQKNTLWDNLTVSEHMSIWRSIKSGKETSEDLERLIADCDLTKKRKSCAKTLSGGQKRKLQLACMFVGDSSVCLIDECTSGLDPLSRRVIWDILLDQRSKRSILFTTHFLDEVDVLADLIVILSKGKVRCSGTSAELKSLHGGSYHLQVPRTAPKLDVPYNSVLHQDSLIYSTPDSRSAAQLLSEFAAAGVTDVSMAGPQVEDVFLKVADEPELREAHKITDGSPSPSDFAMSPSNIVSFQGQVRVLFRKRLTILKRFWWPYFYVLALPLVINPFFDRLLKGYEPDSCAFLAPSFSTPSPYSYHYSARCAGGQCLKLPVAPLSAQDQISDLVNKHVFELRSVEPSLAREFAPNLETKEKFLSYWDDKATRVKSDGGIYGGNGTEAPIIAGIINYFGQPQTPILLNLWSQMTSGSEIISSQGSFAQTRKSSSNSGVVYVVFFTLLQAIYPAAFVLYPAIEKDRKVRPLEYANGVRRGPLWVAYSLFDFMFVLVISIGVTVIMSTQMPFFPSIWIMLPILMLYGVAAMLLGYVISHFVSGPLKSFIATAGMGLLMYAIAAIAFGVGSGYADAAQMDTITLGITFGLNIILPIGNVFRAAMLTLNVLQVACKDGRSTTVGSIYAFGSPILYLVIQIAVLLLIIIWIEGDLALFRRKKSPSGRDSEKRIGNMTDDVENETLRVEQTEGDFLRCLHLSKSFGSNKAVHDVTLGLPESDILALIGPNGAGKSTLVNLIQSELSVDRGQVLLRGEDSRTRSAQKHLGVCPQHDALDFMSTREHLAFYARIKGIQDVKGNVNHLMASLNLTPHASTLASKLSGGNKRKLSLAIALMGTPPVLVLDEPTSAMDAVAKRSFWRVIEKIARDRSVLLTTHSMEEADALATRAAIISKSILAVGTTKALRDKYSNHYYITLVLASAPNSTTEEMEAVRAWVHESLPSSQLERHMLGGQIRFTIPGVDAHGNRLITKVIDLIERYKDTMGIEYYSVGGSTLERVFLGVVRENNVQEEDGRDGRGIRLRRLLRLE
ncbi:hypothetical protein QQS21_011873 [Conoideocrella luteorostrata]|uniref:ABC transporter domain-containing protein n=1 Tax=Conoideocrella luteorostrata TaxID=1105319 RepID=A0AAJ0FN60_9HYPO|nr:hypothetical protein QQS21_011873 [Conoideocrella luteorostrata]